APEEQAAGGIYAKAGHRNAQDGRAAVPNDSETSCGQAQERRSRGRDVS
ncbi:hypothetical protein AVEN_137053-1, partial [Araneus ventricosus]